MNFFLFRSDPDPFFDETDLRIRSPFKTNRYATMPVITQANTKKSDIKNRGRRISPLHGTKPQQPGWMKKIRPLHGSEPYEEKKHLNTTLHICVMKRDSEREK